MSLEFSEDIRGLALGAGADFFGVADLAPVYDAILEQGGESVAQFPRAVAVGIALPHSIIDKLSEQTSVTVARDYWQVYVETNQRLDEITSRLVARLEHAGFSAVAVAASHTTDPDRLCGVFSHKLAAHLAGLGWIGKSCLLITPEAGPRVRWATVLTDALLAATGQAADEWHAPRLRGHVSRDVAPAVVDRCGACEQCVNACPARAFTGGSFRSTEHRDTRFAAEKCKSYVTDMKERMGCPVLCGLCVSVCPHGKPGHPQNH